MPKMPKTTKEFWDDLDDDGKEYVIRRIHRDSRASIRRPEPLVNVGQNNFVRLVVGPGPTAAMIPPQKVSTKPTKPGRNKFEIIDSGSEDDGCAGPPIPGPGVAPRLDYVKIREQLGFNRSCEKHFEREIKVAYANYLNGFRAQYGDLEAMLEHEDWKPYLKRKAKYNNVHTQLEFKGFPLIDDVGMIAHPNKFLKKPKVSELQKAEDEGNEIERDPGEEYTIDDGNCYFTAIALLLYGDARAWLRVKAEHFYYLEHVLLNKEHVRHQFYKRQNAISSNTFATPHGDGTRWSGDVNLWERLQIPNCWMSDEMCALTADVYGVFIVLYSFMYNKNTRTGNIYDMRTYGSFNSRHIFAAYFNRNHFVPLIPNNYYHYEFRLPPITVETTKRHNLRTSATHHQGSKDGVNHYLRCSPRSIPAPLSYPWFDDPRHLRMVVGYHPFSHAPIGSKPIQVTAKPPAILPNIPIGSDLTGYIVPLKPIKPHQTTITTTTTPGKVTTTTTTTPKPTVVPVPGVPPPTTTLTAPGTHGVTFPVTPGPTPKPPGPTKTFGFSTPGDPFTLDSSSSDEDGKGGKDDKPVVTAAPTVVLATPGKHKLDDDADVQDPNKKPKLEHGKNTIPPVTPKPGPGKKPSTTTSTSTSGKKKAPKIQDPTYKPSKDSDEDSDDEFPAFQNFQVKPKPPVTTPGKTSTTTTTTGAAPSTAGAPGPTKKKKWLGNKKKFDSEG